MRLKDVLRDYHAGFRHNPAQFRSDSFMVEKEGRRLVLVGRPKKKVRKGYRIVAILRPIK